TLMNFSKQYTKEQIYRELTILCSKKSGSQNEVFKFIPEPTRLEFLTAIALRQHFKDLEVLPNYSIDDEGLPKCHASGNQPDIICKDLVSNSIIEVSLICGRGQVNNELLPITRHLKELMETNTNQSLKCFAIFIAPKIFEDSKRYVKFIKFDENLDIRNLNILDFIEKLKNADVQMLSIDIALQENPQA
ncbi:MAG: AlwI family type II restriction endonuclease, partial [Helicobacter sp.]|nr:AlwI family type II restriction endonuclease [Helicobacter sp.]